MSNLIRKKYSIENNKIVEKDNGEFYNKNIAIQVCDNMYQLDNGIENSFPELMILFEDEINDKKQEIENLKKQDEKIFEETLKAYDVVGKTEEFQKIITMYKNKNQENAELKNQITKANETIKDLSVKLKIALNRVEELQNIKIGFWQKIRLMFSKQKRLPSGKM